MEADSDRKWGRSWRGDIGGTCGREVEERRSKEGKGIGDEENGEEEEEKEEEGVLVVGGVTLRFLR